MRVAGTTVAITVSVFILVIAYYYYFAIALVPLCVVYFFSAAYYRASAREIKRHESVLRSSVFARFNEAITGTSTLRTYGVQGEFSKRLTDAIDNMDSAYYLTFANQRWLAVRLDAIGAVFLVVTGMLIVTNRLSVSPSISGLVLSYLVAISQLLQFTIRQVADVENNMNAAERIYYYGTSVPEEAPAETQGIQLSEHWPERGQISFKDVHMRYRDGLPLVLKGVNLEIAPGERIGIVGRTGAGKSSIMTALFRLVELSSGQIDIDGVDIKKVGLHDLRSRISIIPQDPTLFRGTVRSNLDPFGEKSDLELWTALRQARLVDDPDPNSTTPGSVAFSADAATDADGNTSRITLESTVESEGTNFSLGQRQLMALARALVRGSQIILCDEATSSIDLESDHAVQQVFARGFQDKTMLCIAHRLETIIGCDRVCVIDDGMVEEIDTPLALYDRGGAFRRMCDQSQIGRDEISLSVERYA